MRIPAALRRLVQARAAGRCEYCQLAQASQEAVFHVNHVIPRYDGGPTTDDNLALACVSCSLRKESRRTGADPLTGKHVALFHARRHHWHDHFRWVGIEVLGLTATGRATIEVLQMNRPLILRIRQEQLERGQHPPPAAEE